MESTITATLVDDNVGPVVLTFDGTVLEVFDVGQTTVRLHVALMVCEVSEPDKKGRVRLDFAPRRAGTNGVRLVLDPENWLRAAPVCSAVQSALAARPTV